MKNVQIISTATIDKGLTTTLSSATTVVWYMHTTTGTDILNHKQQAG